MTQDLLSVTVEFRLGWRWHVAEQAVRVLPLLGVPMRPCLAVLNWGLSGARLNVAGAGWVPAGMPRIRLEDLA